MTKQSEALRLADALDMTVKTRVLSGWWDGTVEQEQAAAAELRRLHALNAELVEALRNYVDGCSMSVDANAVARAVLSKAEAQQ